MRILRTALEFSIYYISKVKFRPHKNLFCSWGSGANPWGHDREDQFASPNHYDGMLEVVGVSGVIHLGQIQSGLRSGIRIAQVCIMGRVYSC